MKKTVFKTTATLGVTIAMFSLLFWPEWFGLRPDQFGGIKPVDLLKEVQAAGAARVLPWLALGFVVKLLGMLCGVVRWQVLLRGQGLRIPFWHMAGTWFAGRTIGIYLPGTLGLDGYRLYDSARYTGEPIKCATVIAIEKLIGFIALTGLVFLTFPLGFKLLNINVPVLAAILTVLGGAVLFFFVLLLNPRVIQVLVAVLPAPRFLRNTVNKLGTAATAYSGSRWELILAVLLGIGVHAATCLMFFCTMMAIRAQNTSLLDILFASPLMIYGTVIGPSVGGEGIREIVFVAILGAKSGAAAAATLGHLGWWVGDVIPFLIGLPILLLRKRPAKEELQAELAETRARSAEMEERVALHLTPEEVTVHQARVRGHLAAGGLSTFLAATFVGMAEAAWVGANPEGMHELGLYWWAPFMYGQFIGQFAPVFVLFLMFLQLLRNRFLSWRVVAVLSFGFTLNGCGLVFGLWRYMRDVLSGHAASAALLAPVAGKIVAAACGMTLLFAIAVYLLSRLSQGRGRPVAMVGVATYILCCIAGALYGRAHVPAPPAPAAATAQATGPNIVFIGVDTLRADALRLLNPQAAAQTPAMDAFAQDAAIFEHASAQASWTKPAFATLLTGLYPSQHTATSKTAAIPDAVETLAERLHAGGYDTRGFANNPNVYAAFGFAQGFNEYTELRPRLRFLAPPSATRLSLYEVMRKGQERIFSSLPVVKKWLGRLSITDFYQPASEVTRVGLDWLDNRPKDKTAPFFLFLHYMDPHDPYFDPDAPGGGFARARMEKPDAALQTAMQKAYVYGVERFDQGLGGLVDGLKRRGLYDNTVIMLVSDHGEEFQEHRGWWHGFTLYEEMLHVPLMLKLPGNGHAGERQTALVQQVDIAPTILHLAGLESGPQMSGQPLYDATTGFHFPASAFAYAENDFEGNVLHALRTPNEKMIETSQCKDQRLAPEEFYDLGKDPGEQQNLAQEAAAQTGKETLRQTMQDRRRQIQMPAAAPTAPVKIDSSTNDQLKAIGYL